MRATLVAPSGNHPLWMVKRGSTPPRLNFAGANRALSTSATSLAGYNRTPLFNLDRAVIGATRGSHAGTSAISITIRDSSDEQWAVVAPPSSTGKGASFLASFVSVLAGTVRPQRQARDTSQNDELELHPLPHRFAAQHLGLVGLASFSRQNSASSSEFQDFSKRYGALRDEDLITLYERLMQMQGFEVGRIAKMKILPDKLIDMSVDDKLRQHAQATKARIERLAPMLGLDKPGPGSPGGEPLLYQPLISLSNGQLRRARIVSALVQLEEAVGEAARRAAISEEDLTSLLILDQPYSGLDEPSRAELGKLLSSLHKKRRPRVVQVLRRQDEMPEGISHIVDIDEHGTLWSGLRSEWAETGATKPEGIEGIRKNNDIGVGQGVGEELAAIRGVSVQYGEKVVLNSIDLVLREGTRMIIKGANGSGKTTLLSLLSGTHPQSFSLPAEQYALFGEPRAAPINASRLLARTIGYFGPDLLAAFPRRGLESGGLTVGGAIASGFTGVFSRIDVTLPQIECVRALVGAFVDCLAFRESRQPSEAIDDDTVMQVMRRPFIELTSGSQAIALFLRAIANDPRILILDEPFQGMDAGQIARVQAYIDGDAVDVTKTKASRLRPRPDCAIVLVSHYVNEWPKTMGEFLHLQDGKVIERI